VRFETRRPRETMVVGETSITVHELLQGRVRLAIDAPPGTLLYRKENEAYRLEKLWSERPTLDEALSRLDIAQRALDFARRTILARSALSTTVLSTDCLQDPNIDLFLETMRCEADIANLKQTVIRVTA